MHFCTFNERELNPIEHLLFGYKDPETEGWLIYLDFVTQEPCACEKARECTFRSGSKCFAETEEPVCLDQLANITSQCRGESAECHHRRARHLAEQGEAQSAE